MSFQFLLTLAAIALSIHSASAAGNALPDVTNQFIVGFKPHVLATDMQPALQKLATALTPSVEPQTAGEMQSSTLPTAGGANDEPFQVLSILSPGDAAAAADATVQASSAAATSGPVVLLRLADPAAADLLKARHDVAFVLQDAIITAAAEVSPAMASPVPTSSALPTRAGQVAAASAGGRRGQPPSTTSGSCAPATGTTATAATPVKLRQPVPCGNGSTDTLIYQGRTCGRGLQSVRWMSATGPDGCIIKRQGGQQFNKEVFGDCGIAPSGLAVPGSLGVRACPPVPAELPPPVCPRQKPFPDATLPSGVVQIEAFRAGRVAKPVAPGLAKVVVGIMATGIEERPDDYTLAGGRSWIGNPDLAMTDLHGSGTHNAGIVAARSFAIVGVAPGVPVYSLKVLSSSGAGRISDVLSAIEWAAGPEAAAASIKVLLMPLTFGVPGRDPAFADYQAVICGAMAKLEAAGVLVVAAAGISAESPAWTLPAACPTVLVATGEPIINSGLPTANMTLEDAARVVSAPGLNINSTFPRGDAVRLAAPERSGGYGPLNGTSAVASHVAGVAANCVASGACSTAGGPAAWRKLIVQAAVERATSYSPIFGAAHNPRAGDRFYGYALWSKW